MGGVNAVLDLVSESFGSTCEPRTACARVDGVEQFRGPLRSPDQEVHMIRAA
jgi:hypothetical protein